MQMRLELLAKTGDKKAACAWDATVQYQICYSGSSSSDKRTSETVQCNPNPLSCHGLRWNWTASREMTPRSLVFTRDLRFTLAYDKDAPSGAERHVMQLGEGKNAATGFSCQKSHTLVDSFLRGYLTMVAGMDAQKELSSCRASAMTTSSTFTVSSSTADDESTLDSARVFELGDTAQLPQAGFLQTSGSLSIATRI